MRNRFATVSFSISVFSILCFSPSPMAAQVIQWPSAVGGNDHYYDVIRTWEPYSWDNARTDAESRGAHLATLTSQEEQDFVYDHLVSDPQHWNGRIGPWIGLHQTTFDAEPAGGWEWVTGEAFGYDSWDVWEPNDFDGDENYAQFFNNSWITPSPNWNDTKIDQGSTYLIEYEIPMAVTMAEARNVPLGMLLTVEGVVTTKTDLVASPHHSSISVQDSTGGMTVFGPLEQMNQLFDSINEGDSVSLTGITKNFNGLLELDTGFGQFSVTVEGTPGVPEPTLVSIDDFNGTTGTAEALESTLVTLVNVVISPRGKSIFEARGNYLVSSESPRVFVRVSTEELDLVGTLIPPGPVSITGIFSQYDNTEPFTSGYQLLVRSLADIQLGGDFNGDGMVDAADYTVWRDNLGSTSATNAHGDADGDGDVDNEDYLAWQLQYGFSSAIPPTATTVPEPSTAGLLFFAACFGLRCRTRRSAR